MEKNKVLLAFSGGLDTSYCVKYLMHEKQMDVYTAVVNTGGFSEVEIEEIKRKAYDLGSTNHAALDETNSFYQEIVRYLIYGNVLKNNTYPLSVSAERIHQACALVKYAKEIGVAAISHGSTGAGNDQIRFDLVFQLLAPEIEIITPIRDQELSRKDEIEYLKSNGVDLNWDKAKYSINKGLWGTSIGGAETLTSNEVLAENAYPDAMVKTKPQSIELEFEKGEIIGIDGRKMDSVTAIQTLDSIASKYAIGRDIHVGDTIIGIKGRVGFAAAAPVILIKAHHTLEKHTLSKWQLHWKEQLGSWYGMFIHEAQYFEPVMRNIEAFLEDSQTYVSGKVFVELYPYRFVVKGIESKHDLMSSDFGDYGEANKRWSGEDAKGFTKLMANPMQLFNHVNEIV